MWHTIYNWLKSIHKAEWLFLVALIVHIVFVPYTEVDESFNMQAIHDILYHRLDWAKYHHLENPGLVPYTFIGPLAVASNVLPFQIIFGLLGLSKFWTLLAVRFVLGLAVFIPFCLLARAIERRYYFFDSRVGTFLRIITATQFYFLFYASRPMSNTFAMVLFLLACYRVHEKDHILAAILASIAICIFQYELILFFSPLFLLNFKIPEIIKQYKIGAITMVISLAITIPIDSYFWGYLIWPEARMIKFKFWDNRKRIEVLSFLWHFFAAQELLLLLSGFFVQYGLEIHQRLQYTLWSKIYFPAKIFFYLNLFLGRKELRFFLYILPIFNVPAAVYCAHHWKRFNQERLFIFRRYAHLITICLFLNAMITTQWIYASHHSYSGAKALIELQSKERYSRNKPINIHMDKYCTETGISRFIQLHDNWKYNKTENLPPNSLKQFDYILIGSMNKDKLIEDFGKANLSFPFVDYFSIEAYHQILWRNTSYWIPLYKPEIYYERAVVMKKIQIKRT